MGGGKGSKKQTVGHKYFFGEHLILASNPLAIMKLKFQDKDAWLGRARGNSQIKVDKENLFGGKKREGGVAGAIDVMDGRATQGVNDYLAAHIGAPLPAFRHMTSLVLRHFYHGNNYYPKAPAIKAMDAHIGATWYQTKAWFPRGVEIADSEIYIGIDTSASMDTNNRYLNARDAAVALVRELKGSVNSVRVHLAQSAGGVMMTRRDCNNADYEDIATWLEGQTRLSASGQFYLNNVASAFSDFVTESTSAEPPRTDDEFFSWPGLTQAPTPAPNGRRVCIVLTDGGAPDYVAAKTSFDAISRLELFCVAVDNLTIPASLAYVDNTPEDSVPLPRGGNATDLLWAIRQPISSWNDLNPVHMLRDALTATEDNQNANTDKIGDSFVTAADTLFDEGFGLSFYWRNGSDLDKFRTKIEEHIDAAVYFSRSTGKWEIKLIRDDYDIESLPVLDVLEWKNDVSREVAAELPNKLTITYRKILDGKKKSIPATDPASIAVTGTVRSVKIDFDGIYDADLAAKVAARELRNRSQPKWSGTIVVGSVPADFDLGSAFLIINPDYGMDDYVVCRAVEILYDVGNTRNITIKFIEDKFSLGDVVDLDLVEATPPVRDALNVLDYYLEEAPYYMLVQEFSQSNTDDELANDPLLGRLFVGAAKPSPFHVSLEYAYNLGNGWESSVSSVFTPAQSITADLSDDPTETTITILSTSGLDNVEPGTLALIGTEIIRIDNLDTTGGTYTLTIGRGCLDTLPKNHLTGATILFFEDYGVFDQTTYLSTETTDIRMLTETTSDELTLAEADTHNVVFAHRAIRPYRVGDFRANGAHTYTHAGGDVILTWKHRDRTLQTTTTPEDYLADNIGPEPGVSYQVQIEALDSSGASLSLVVDTNVAQATTYTFIGSTPLPPGTQRLAFRVKSLRDGYENWQTPEIIAPLLAAPTGLVGVETIAAPGGLSGSIV